MCAAMHGQTVSCCAKEVPVFSGGHHLRSNLATHGRFYIILELFRPADIFANVKGARCGRAHDFANDLLGTRAARTRDNKPSEDSIKSPSKEWTGSQPLLSLFLPPHTRRISCLETLWFTQRKSMSSFAGASATFCS